MRGTGTIGGGGVFEDGALFLFDPVATLTVEGNFSFANFGVDDVVGLVDFTTIGNKTLETAYDLGGGKSAYFEEGSFSLGVIPEPATLGMVVALGGGLLWLRRVFMV